MTDSEFAEMAREMIRSGSVGVAVFRLGERGTFINCAACHGLTRIEDPHPEEHIFDADKHEQDCSILAFATAVAAASSDEEVIAAAQQYLSSNDRLPIN